MVRGYKFPSPCSVVESFVEIYIRNNPDTKFTFTYNTDKKRLVVHEDKFFTELPIQKLIDTQSKWGTM